jgi:hypothetical protein
MEQAPPSLHFLNSYVITRLVVLSVRNDKHRRCQMHSLMSISSNERCNYHQKWQLIVQTPHQPSIFRALQVVVVPVSKRWQSCNKRAGGVQLHHKMPRSVFTSQQNNRSRGQSIVINARATRHRGLVTKKHSFRNANAAKECDHVGFVVVDGTFEGSATIAATRRVSGEKRHAKANQAHRSVAAASAFAKISVQHTSTCPQMAEWCKAIK